MNCRRVFLAVGLLSVVLGGCKTAPPAAADDAEAAGTATIEVATAAPKDMEQTLDVSGSFGPSQGGQARLTSALAGRVAHVFVHEGDHVAAGQLLANIDLRVQGAQQSSAAAASAAAQAQAAQSQIAYQSASADQASSVRIAEIALEQAKLERASSVDQAQLAYVEADADLAKLRAGARPQEIAQAHEATVQAQAARDRAAAEYRRDQDLSPDGYVSRRQLEDAKTALDTSDSALLGAKASESLVRAGPRPEELRAQEAHTAALREAVNSAKTIGDQKISAATASLNQAKLGVLSVRQKLKDVEIAAAATKQKAADASSAAATTALGDIRAPFDGVITRRILNPGDYADTVSPVLEITASKAKIDFVAGALPSQAAQIRPGMDVEVDTQAEPVPGHVLSVSPADPQTGLSVVRIGCDKPAFSGAFSVAHIVLHQYPKIVAAPSECVLDKDGKTVVFKVADGVAKQLEVHVGAEQDGFAGFVEGVKAGDVLAKIGGYELSDGAKVKVAAPEAPDAGASDKKEPGS